MNNIDNLIFFNEKGYEIPVLKTYTLEWEIIPNDQVKNNFITNPKGHFLVDLDNNVSVIIDDPGKILLYNVNLVNKLNNTTGITVSSYKDICLLNKTAEYTVTTGGLKGIQKEIEVTEDIQNIVRITINTLDNTVVQEVPIDIFNNCTFEIVTNIDIENNKSEYYILSMLSLDIDNNTNKTFVNLLIENIFGSVKELYPGIRYMGLVTQDKVSEEFIAASAFIILSENSGNYKNPLQNNTGGFKFEFQDNSEMKFISSNTVADIIWENTHITLPENNTDENTPVYFTIGFKSDVEGCYQNIMAMYIHENNLDYLCGLFTFLTEVEGEDERYRALLGNLGIPDPINYPNIFKSQEPLEECVDWTLINKKSKELMINYDNIFPYAGTYKALLNAVKFLGYYDLVFKEWYKIKDLNNRDKYITLQTYDTVTGKSLKSKLKLINVDFGEFERYKKINRLTMVYHIDLIDEDNTTESLYEYGKKQYITFDIPLIKKLYEYRTDEILAKLYSVKVWLENHILGVNCYISDICGEGLVIERTKSLVYVTEHYLQDFYSEAYVTPKITDISEFKKSNAAITCSLNEYNSVSFETYKNTPIDAFIKKTILNRVGSNIYISNPLGALILVDELQYELHTENCSSGSLYEFMGESYTSNPIIIQDNNIILYDNKMHTSIIDNNECPIIELEEANIRTVYGNWKTNIKYAISTTTDPKTGNIFYNILRHDINTSGEIEPTNVYRDIKKVVLYPEAKSANPYDQKSSFIYTSNNQWNVPMIIIRNYVCNEFDGTISEQDYILEIIKGRLIFRNKRSDISDLSSNKCVGAEVLFGYEDLSFDDIKQSILINYTYMSDRSPVFTVDERSLLWNYEKNSELFYRSIEQYTDYNTDITINVNRACDYTVTVKGYDAYNHIYVNKSDKLYTVYTTPINIETILNSPKIVNKKSFNESTYFGNILELKDSSLLVNSVLEYPIFPKSYRIYDIDPLLDKPNTIEYNNISYAIDTPKNKDYIVFNNFTERVSDITISEGNNTFTIKLFDGNPNPDTLKYSAEIGLCLYDNIKKEIVKDIFPLTLTDINIIDTIDPTTYVYDNANSTISGTYKSANQSDITNIKNEIASKEYMYAYVYNTTSILLDTSLINVDYNKNETYIQYTSDVPVYKENDLVKLCYHKQVTPDSNLYNKSVTICNEACYRIKEIILEDTNYIYVLDGVFDLYKLNNKLYNNIQTHTLDNNYLKYAPIGVSISPAHLSAALYILRATTNGAELAYNYNGAVIQRTLVSYESGPLLFDSYLDTNYSASIYKFNPKILNDIWVNDLNLYYNFNTINNGIYRDILYKYVNKPVTIDKDRMILITYDKSQDILYNDNVPYKILWDWYSYLVELVANPSIKRNYTDKRLIFLAENDILSIAPNILGPLIILLTVTDLYGNRIVNHGEGLLYVLKPKRIYVKRPKTLEKSIRKIQPSILSISIGETDPKNMVYGNKNINNNVVAADGENVTVYLNDNTIYKASKSAGMSYPVNVPYAIYYSDGTIKYNEGAKLTLLDENGLETKGNKVKLKFGKALQEHKHIAKTLKVKILAKNNMKNDIVQETCMDVPIKQYGSVKTTKISKLLFLLDDVEQCGIREINNEILSYMIHNITYDMERSDGSIEHITGKTLENVNLIVTGYKFISTRYGYTNSIEENMMNKRTYIGIIIVTVKFFVHGVTDIIETTYTTQVYQQ